MVITRLQGKSIVTLRGPETKPTEMLCPANGEWLAVRFKAGTFMPQLPVRHRVNSLGINLPQVSKRALLLEGLGFPAADARFWAEAGYTLFVGMMNRTSLVEAAELLIARNAHGASA